MSETYVIHRRDDDEPTGLSWPRIIGIAFVIALHAAALLLLLIPAVAPKAEKEQEQKTLVTIVDAPPPNAAVMREARPYPVELPTTSTRFGASLIAPCLRT